MLEKGRLERIRIGLTALAELSIFRTPQPGTVRTPLGERESE